MNKYSTLLLGSTALTLVTFQQASALTVLETSDFGNSFASRFIIDVTGGSDGSASGPADASASSGADDPASSGTPGASASGSIFSGVTIFGNLNALSPTGGSSAAGDFVDFFSLSGLTAGMKVNINVRPDSRAAASSAVRESFAINLLDSFGRFLDLDGDSGSASASASDAASSSNSADSDSPSAESPNIFSSTFSFDASALSNGMLNFRIESGLEQLQNYEINVLALESGPVSSVDAPSSAAGLAVGAVGLGFLAARRRRQK